MITLVESEDNLRARIKVIGVGGGGGNAVNRMIQSDIKGVEFISANTDAQALRQSLATYRIQLGENCTKGLGAGGNPEVGRAAAEESKEMIKKAIAGADMVFVTVGMGGGTGTGASPVFAAAAKEAGILTVVIATKPFTWEGHVRASQAEEGLKNVEGHADTIIAIPNQNLLSRIDEHTLMEDAYKIVDDVLRQGVQAITDIITSKSLIQVDFADIRAIMKDAGRALMGIGEGRGPNRTIDAIRQAKSSPLLEDISIEGARGLLVNFTGNPENLTMFEVSNAMELVYKEISPKAHVYFGQTYDEKLEDRVRVTVVATNFEKVPRRPERSEEEDYYYSKGGAFESSNIGIPPALRKKGF